jgi:hypothetical protein
MNLARGPDKSKEMKRTKEFPYFFLAHCKLHEIAVTGHSRSAFIEKSTWCVTALNRSACLNPCKRIQGYLVTQHLDYFELLSTILINFNA